MSREKFYSPCDEVSIERLIDKRNVPANPSLLIDSFYCTDFLSIVRLNSTLLSFYSTLYCMNDSPFDSNWPELDIPIGRNWDLDEQCVKDFGTGFRLCSRVSII